MESSLGLEREYDELGECVCILTSSLFGKVVAGLVSIKMLGLFFLPGAAFSSRSRCLSLHFSSHFEQEKGGIRYWNLYGDSQSC